MPKLFHAANIMMQNIFHARASSSAGSKLDYVHAPLMSTLSSQSLWGFLPHSLCVFVCLVVVWYMVYIKAFEIA